MNEQEMAPQLYWHESMAAWTWERLKRFLDENLPEGRHLEYKQPSYNKQSGKWELGRKLLETIVSMANTDDGLIIIGVAEETDKYPGTMVGINHADPEGALRNTCANSIEPSVPLEIQAIPIPPSEEHAGKAVLVVRVRRGLNPPYLLREHGVFLRMGDQDRHASVGDLQMLFERRSQTQVPEITPWNDVVARVFRYFNAFDQVPLPSRPGLRPVHHAR